MIWTSRPLLRRYGSITVLVGRMLPIVRTFIALPAGIARMNQLKFHLYTFIGSWPWCYALAYIGMKLGDASRLTRASRRSSTAFISAWRP